MSLQVSSLLLPLATEELLEKLRALAREHACSDFHFVVEAGVIEHLEHGARRAGFRITGAVNQARYTCMNQRSSAHGAWFNGGVNCATSQAMVAQPCSCLAQGHDFRVRSGIVIEQVAIVPSADDFALSDD
jgi:hypothetical protein